jgi:hypothetical protein
MLSWHNNPALKAGVLERMREHRRQDTIIQGAYQRFAPDKAIGYRGCAIGCTLPVQPEISIHHATREPMRPALGWHKEVENEYGIPSLFGHLIDHVFECLPKGEHAEFAVDVIEAIPVGKDLTVVAVKLLHDLQARHPVLTKGWMVATDPYGLAGQVEDLAPGNRGQGRSGNKTYYRWIRDRFLHHLRALEPAPPLIQHIDIPEPEPILIRTVVNN